MTTFVMLTRLAPTALEGADAIEKLEKQVVARLRSDVPGIEWVGNYSVLGPYDYVDIFRAPDIETAMKVSAVVRTYGHAHTEIWAATEWQRFKELVGKL